MEVKELKGIDADQYIGEKVDIVKAEFIMSQYGQAIKLSSEPIQLKGDDTMPEGKQLIASKIFGLFEEEGEIVISKDSVLETFLKAKGIDPKDIPVFDDGETIKVLEGISCKVQKNKKGYLEVA